MKTLWLYILDFCKEFYKQPNQQQSQSKQPHHWLFWVGIFLFLGAAVWLDLQYDIKDSFAPYFGKTSYKFLRAWLFFTLPVVFPFVLYASIYNTSLLYNRKMWVLLILIPCIYAISVTVHLQQYVLPAGMPYTVQRNIGKVLLFPSRTFWQLVLPLGVWLWLRTPGESYFGFHFSRKSMHIYGQLALVSLGIAAIAATGEDFQKYYPMYKPGKELAYLGLSMGQAYAIYEFLYAFSFVGVEFFFRGFMVLALAKFMGSGAIWVMASMYTFIHFGKPVAEVISSFFGGAVLGILTLRTGSIYGGIVLHVLMAVGVDILSLAYPFW
jgi:hypothetical protein